MKVSPFESRGVARQVSCRDSIDRGSKLSNDIYHKFRKNGCSEVCFTLEEKDLPLKHVEDNALT